MNGRPAIDITGKRFGHWTVLTRAGTAKGNAALWRCRCDCGKEKDLDGCALRKGNTLSCGSHERKKLAGNKYGKLTVIKYTERGRWLCECDCGKTSVVTTNNLTSGKTHSCGCGIVDAAKQRLGPLNPLWKGGRTLTGQGYILTRVEDPQRFKALPRRGKNIKQVQEHIVVMSKHLGRPLGADESVHHRNGIRSDNRIENLELMIHHPCGQRVNDAIDYAIQIIKRYKPELLKDGTGEH